MGSERMKEIFPVSCIYANLVGGVLLMMGFIGRVQSNHIMGGTYISRYTSVKSCNVKVTCII